MSGAAAEFLRAAATAGTAQVEKVARTGKSASARYCTCSSSGDHASAGARTGYDVLASAGCASRSARARCADTSAHTGARRTADVAGPAGGDRAPHHGARLMARPASAG